MRAAALAVALVLPLAAQAQWSGSVGADSDYRFRGVPLGGSKPTVRASANYDAPGGWYAGASLSQAQIVAGDRYTQLLAYAGRVRPLGSGALDLGLTGWSFVAEHRYDFVEAYAGLLFDPVSVRLNYAASYFGWNVQTAYLDASAQLPLRNGLRLLAHAGVLVPLTRLDVPFFPDANRTRTDVRGGIGWALRDLDLSLTWAKVTRGGPPPATPPAKSSGWAVAGTWYF